MSKRRWTAMVWVAALLLLPFVVFGSGNYEQIAHAQAPLAGDDFTRLEKKSRGSIDDSSLRSLVDEVARIGNWESAVFENSAIKGRVFRAEQRFRQKGHAPITHQDVARALNLMSGRLQLPEFTRTSKAQVASLRSAYLTIVPHFIGPQRVLEIRPGGGKSEIPMSPLQAVFIASAMIQQKLISGPYQDGPREWQVLEARRRQLRWAEKRQQLAEGHLKAQEPASTVIRNESEREKLVGALLEEKVGNMSSADLQKNLNQLLDDMGVDR